MTRQPTTKAGRALLATSDSQLVGPDIAWVENTYRDTLDAILAIEDEARAAVLQEVDAAMFAHGITKRERDAVLAAIPSPSETEARAAVRERIEGLRDGWIAAYLAVPIADPDDGPRRDWDYEAGWLKLGWEKALAALASPSETERPG